MCNSPRGWISAECDDSGAFEQHRASRRASIQDTQPIGPKRQARTTQRETRPSPFIGPFCYTGRFGSISVRHMKLLGETSHPRPSGGCLKCRPMTSMNGSRLGRASGSKL